MEKPVDGSALQEIIRRRAGQAEFFIYVIYKNPVDYPDDFIVRKHFVKAGMTGPTDELWICLDLEDARNVLPKGLVKLGRYPGDEKQIVEVWV